MSGESKTDEPAGEWLFAGAIAAHDADVRAIVATPAGVVTGGRDNSVRLFSEHGDELSALRFDSWVLALALLGGNRVVAGLQDGSCRVLALSAAAGVAELARAGMGTPGRVAAASFSPTFAASCRPLHALIDDTSRLITNS